MRRQCLPEYTTMRFWVKKESVEWSEAVQLSRWFSIWYNQSKIEVSK